MKKPTKKTKRRLVAHHKHTGKVLPRQHTSYPLLVFILLIIGVFLLALTINVAAATLEVTASVAGTPPGAPAVITSPPDGTHFTTIPQTISGTCPATYMVKLFRNDFFSGSTICTASDTFEIQSDLFAGKNTLKAQVYNYIDQEGPASPTIDVFYDAPVPPPSAEVVQSSQAEVENKSNKHISTSGQGIQLMIGIDSKYKSYRAGTPVQWHMVINGGTAPYAISIDWGDGRSEVISRSIDGTFVIQHSYQGGGIPNKVFKIVIKAADSGSQTAQVQLVAIITNPLIQAGTTGSDDSLMNTLNQWRHQLLLAWPLYTSAVLMVVSFWLGERREFNFVRKLSPRRRKVGFKF